MSVDKFGHYLNDTNSSIFSTKNAPKLLGFFMDADNNINVQNKRIKNVAKALEENDVINKLFLQTQIEKTEDKLKLYFKEDNIKMRDDLLSQIIKLQSEIKLQLEDYYKIEENLSKLKSFFENEVQKFNEKIYRIENYLFVSVADSGSIILQHNNQDTT